MKRNIIKLIFILINSVHVTCTFKVHTECRNRKHLALTFDDGPHRHLSPRLLKLLDSYNLKVTFFYNGPLNWKAKPQFESPYSWNHDMKGYSRAVRRAYRKGHQIGNHSWSHRDLTKLSPDEVREELRMMHNMIRAITGRNMTVFRAPFGFWDDTILEIAEVEFGYSIVAANIDTKDWAKHTPSEGVLPFRNVIENGGGNGKGFISVNHEYISNVVETMNKTIQYLRRKGLHIVTVAECIGVPMYR